MALCFNLLQRSALPLFSITMVPTNQTPKWMTSNKCKVGHHYLQFWLILEVLNSRGALSKMNLVRPLLIITALKAYVSVAM